MISDVLVPNNINEILSQMTKMSCVDIPVQIVEGLHS